MSILIVDSSYLVFRSFFAYPRLTDPKGFPTGALYGFCKTVISLIQRYKPDQVVFAKDLKQPTWRHKIYTEYKAGRPEVDPKMIQQFPIIYNWCDLVNPNTIGVEGFEADDVIFTTALEALGFSGQIENGITLQNLAQNKAKIDQKVYIFSSDKDLYQLLVLPNIVCLKSKKGGELEEYDKQKFMLEFNVKPIQWVDFKALVGDSSDNLKGIEGVGPKTAANILNSVSNLYQLSSKLGLNPEAFTRSNFELNDQEKTSLDVFITNPKNQIFLEKFRTNFELICKMYNLASLQFVPNSELKNLPISLEKGEQLFIDYNFSSLLKDIQKIKQQSTKNLQDSLF